LPYQFKWGACSVRARFNKPFFLLFASSMLMAISIPTAVGQSTSTPTATGSDGAPAKNPTVLMNMNQNASASDSSNDVYQPGLMQQGAVSASQQEADKYRKHKNSLVGGLFKGVGKELGSSVEYMGKDAAFVFSAQDYDANKTSAPSDKPYEEYHIRWDDGSRSNIIRYPDGKRVITSGYRTGTVITPINDVSFDIQYPNGHHSTARETENGGYIISRYDGKTFRLSPQMGGGFYITGPDGEMGTLEPSVVDTHYGYYSKRDSMEF
jgi:hypothetical protein